MDVKRKIRKKPTSLWLQEKLERILEMTDIACKKYPGDFIEPDYGFWSLKKEIALMYWIWPFLQIASKYFKHYYYIDLFSGSGLVKADSSFFVGSPLVAICSTLPDKKFTQFVCFEVNNDRKNSLEKRTAIAAEKHETCQPKIFNADCNQNIKNILEECCPSYKSCYLAFIDPQGFTDLKWNTIEQLLKHGKGDIILNFPTYGINRNMNIERSKNSLTEFFGDNLWCDKTNSEELIKHYMNKIASFGKAVDNVTVKDGSNHTLYDLIFATGSSGMNNVMTDLKSILEKIKTKDFQKMLQVLAGPQEQLIRYNKM